MEKVFKETSKAEFNYVIYKPTNCEEGKLYPLILFLHGAGERGVANGAEIDKIFKHGLPNLLQSVEHLDAYVVMPQCPTDEIWDINVKELKSFLDKILSWYSIDENKVSITGLSMGGFGAWAFAETYPQYFSAIATVCGSGMSWRANLVKDIPIKVFHGDADKIVPISYSYEIVNHLLSLGAKPEFTIYHNVGHNSWVNAYTMELVNWLISQDKSKSKVG